MKYKGFAARVEFAADDNVFVGRVIGIDDVVMFESESVEGLKKAFEEAVDFHLEVCEKVGKKPLKVYSGKVNFRFPSELHALIAQRAAATGKSINEYGKEVFEKTLVEGV